MDLKNKVTADLHESLKAEIKKAKNEIRCVINDAEKAALRLNFSVIILNELLQRKD